MTSREKIKEILTSNAFSDAEKFVVRAQFRESIPISNFEEKLWSLMCAADVTNLMRIGKGFPEEAHAVDSWKHGDLGKRLRAVGLDI